jgi:polyisoprenoid-binding protein YceI
LRRCRRWAAPAVAAALLLPGALAAQALTPLPLRRGEVVVDVRATKVNDFDTRAGVSAARFSGSDLANVTGVFEVRVADMRTGIGLRDRHLRNTMHADSFPVVRFELIGVDTQAATGDSIAVTFQGRLTLHGVTRVIRVPGTLVRRLTMIEVIVTRYPLDMREYGVTPPTRFLGAIRVQPDVHVNARLLFGQ